jgi:uncharacterized protein (TIGR03067 family)
VEWGVDVESMSGKGWPIVNIARIVLLLTAFHALAGDEPQKKRTDDLKGSWSVVSMTLGGQPAPEDLVKNYEATFDGRNYKNIIGKEVLEEGDYTIDETKSPKTIDLDIKTGPDHGKRQLGIYKIDGETLTLVFSEPDSGDRPKSFETSPGIVVLKIVLKRSSS